MELSEIIKAIITVAASVIGSLLISAYKPTKDDVRKYAKIIFIFALRYVLPIAYLIVIMLYKPFDKTFVITACILVSTVFINFEIDILYSNIKKRFVPKE